MRFLLVILLLLTFQNNAEAQNSGQDYYSIAKDFYDSRDLNSALQTSINAFNEIEDSTLIDPRIGSLFIEIVTDQKLDKLYQAASVIYLWALSTTGEGIYSEYLLTEILKSEPVFDQWEFRKFEKMAKKDPIKAAKIVKQKWQTLDPTPNTRTNERLIEHWERIVFSKQNFTKADNTIYGTDDRAKSYIRYGKPGLKFSGTLNYDAGTILTSISIVLNPNDKDVKKLIEDCLMSYYAADYEIWVYPFLSGEGRVVKIFGDRYTTRSFQEIEVLTDFIPTYAFNRTKGVSRQGSTYTPGFFLLHSYFQQLITVDSYFSDQYISLNELLTFPNQGISSKPLSTTATWIFPQVRSAAADMNRILSDAPIEQSTYLKSIDSVDVKVKKYNFYDESGNPLLFYAMNSYPLYRMLDYMAKEERNNLEDYSLVHNVSVANIENADFKKLSDRPDLPFLTKKVSHPAQSIFKISPKSKDSELVFSVQVFDDLAKNEMSEAIFPKALKAIGREYISEIKFRDNNNNLALSDVMIGYQMGDVNLEDEITFLVAIDNKIPSFSNLFLHFQAINLTINEEEKANLNVELSVSEKNGLLRFLTRNKTNAVSFNYFDSSNQIRENLEFELVDRKPGKYELTIKITDRVSGDTVTKKVDFEIINIE